MRNESENNISKKDLEKIFSLTNLEFEKVKHILENHAYSSIGKSWVRSLVPLRVPWKIMFHQMETSESRLFIDREERLPSFVNLQDVRSDVRLAVIGSTLTTSKLWKIAGAVRSVRQIKESLTETAGNYPLLSEFSRRLIVFTEMERFLFDSLDDEETISDNATSDLRKYRHNLREQNYRIQEKSRHLARKYSDRNLLTDSTFTIRNNRYVLPFSSGAMGREKVIIQSSSESGLTFYGEPLELVELNNELQRAIQQVRNEEEKILQMLSAGVGEIGERLIPCVEICGYLDFIFAKGYLSRNLDAVEPVFDPSNIKLEKIRHPLLKKEIVIPIDLEFGGDKKGLILTGPNAGGKTVSLKTLGLSALMSQAGLHIPAKEKSCLPVFSSVLAEIGDAQSIDLDLSSFGAHVEFLKKVIASVNEDVDIDNQPGDEWVEKYRKWTSRGREVTKEYDEDDTFTPYLVFSNPDMAERFENLFTYDSTVKPLILLDEIGRSTDPQEGSALALALIDKLVQNDSFFALTTHLPALKNLVIEENSAVTGASMGFDLEKMETTYKIEKDAIGASYGIVIAEKMGLNREILENAKARMEDRYKLLEMDIPKLEKKKDELQDYVGEWEKKKRKASTEELRELSRLILLKKMGMEYLMSTMDKADDILQDTMKRTDRLIELARKGKRVRKEIDKKRKKINKLRDQIEDAVAALHRLEESQETKTEEPGEIEKIEVGQRVWVSLLNREGIVDQIKKDGKRLVVIFDGKKMEIDSNQATPVETPVVEEKKSRIEVNVKSRKRTPLWLDLHGERVEPALEKVEEFLHDAFMDHRAQVNIIHGIGTGALRKAIRELLRTHPLVESFRDGDPSEGAIGTTIVEFKQPSEY